MQLKHQKLESHKGSVNSILCSPQKIKIDLLNRITLCVFTHGYTSSKQDLIPWMQKLAEYSIPSCIFDLPGHYLGGSSTVESIEDFFSVSLNSFHLAINSLIEFIKNHNSNKKFHIIIGGHSLGGLLAILCIDALNENLISSNINFDLSTIAVGLGRPDPKAKHLFETELYRPTLEFREQLVSKSLNYSNILPWLQNKKLQIQTSKRNIHLICGKDDIVVGKDRALALKNELESQNNNVSLEEPNRLPHHEPGLASSFIYRYIKTNF